MPVPDAVPPAVDLAVHVVAAAFAGEKPSAGYSIEVTGADRAGGIDLVAEERGPGPGMVAAAIITSPFHIVAVPRDGGGVGWIEDRGSRTEDRDVASSTPDPRCLEPRPPILDRPAAPHCRDARVPRGAVFGRAPADGGATNSDVRFHAWQSIVGLGGLGLAVMTSYILAFVAMFVSTTAVLLMVSVAYVIWIVLALVWLICLWQAWSGGRWKLPLVGDYAERFN